MTAQLTGYFGSIQRAPRLQPWFYYLKSTDMLKSVAETECQRDVVMPEQVAQKKRPLTLFLICTGLCVFMQQGCNRINRSQLEEARSGA